MRPSSRPDLAAADPAPVFAALFDAYAAALLRYAASRLGPAPAEDIVAETFLVALQHRDRYDRSRADIGPWLFGIATNLLRRHVRQQQRRQRAESDLFQRSDVDAPDPIATAPDRIDARSVVRRLAAALDHLSDGDREVILLVAVAQLDTVEVAQALGIPPGTVRSRLHRARRILRTHASNLAGADPRADAVSLGMDRS